MRLARFLATPAGRLLRIVAGIVLIAVGLFVVRGTVGVVIAAAGLIPISAGVFNLCLLAPLLGSPLHGRDAWKA